MPTPRDQTCVILGRLSKGQPCPRCQGRRTLPDANPPEPCPACLGSGFAGDSIAAQEERAASYARYQKFTVAATCSDDDTTGDTYKLPLLDRPGGRAAFRLIDGGTVGHLIVAKLDRLGRRTKDLIALIERLESQKVRLHIVNLGGMTVDSGTPFGKFLLTILAAVAELELEEIRSRTTQRLDSKRSNCEIVGTIPYGWNGYYTFGDADFDRMIESNTALNATQVATLAAEHGPLLCKRLHPERFEQAVIRWAVKARFPNYPDTSRTGFGFNVIADELNTRVIPAKRGGKWQAGNVQGIIMGSYTQRMLAGTLPAELIAELRPEELL